MAEIPDKVFVEGKLVSIVPEQLQVKMARYPQQNDPDYWKKVPQLFDEEFSNPKNLETFRSNWIIFRVPLLPRGYDDLCHHYSTQVANMVVAFLPKEQWASWFQLFKEDTEGHTEESYKNFTITINLAGTDGTLALQESGFYKPIMLHHILKYELMTGKKVADYDTIVEFGGGVGDLVKTMRARGFAGEYYDIDFKPMCRINQYNNRKFDSQNFYFQTIDQLPDLTNRKVLFMSTWSFSEIPLETREQVFAKMNPTKCDWLIAFQNYVFGIDNLNYFIDKFARRNDLNTVFEPLWWHYFNKGNEYMFATNKG